ncbi:PrsW family intramembrane metalloprotease [Streptomyces sp. NBC_01433]|uniref:PrsW family intramembrane metalloprotease n=1 Tax=Streptomyces sp. NBC_01433 TaxID=2903864 RepID=UPI00224E295C|nr:PrsW family intramembrane metalloprotease [Streptomyces sp. NBC_01433]MCX4677140.1 PrsW family intramembrane metalloprotease [Streptomyces sp. NBC_01433]
MNWIASDSPQPSQPSQSPRPTRPPQGLPEPPQPRPGLWKRCLWGGIALWILTAIVTYTTQNTTLLPTLILLGSFLVPAVFVLWAYERHGLDLGAGIILGCFLTGGILGVLGASVMEYYLLHPSVWMFLGVGLIEEAVKLLALMFILRRYPHIHGMRAGLVLGATVGFGFAAFESAGYAFNAAVTMKGIDLRALLETEVLRGVLAPFGHGLWTAIAGGVLLSFRKPNGHFHFAAPVIGTYLGVAVLHCLWDSMHGISIWLVARITDTGLSRALFSQGYMPHPTDQQQHLFTLFNVSGMVAITVVALVWLRSLARSSRRGREARIYTP